MKFTPIADSGEVDLGRHCLIEASAGTGKTFTIENLVVRLLQEREDLHLENILLVTFTEKATSELKNRIRLKLEETLDDPACGPTLEKRMGEALDQFDTAAIYTIHGFCHTVLRDFAFENQSLFESELINDSSIVSAVLREQMRRDWPVRYGGHLAYLLQAAGIPGGQAAFEANVTRIAGGLFRPEYGDRLLPGDQGLSATQRMEEMASRVKQLRSLVGSPPSFCDDYENLNIRANLKNARLQRILLPMEAFLDQTGSREDWLVPLEQLIRKIAQFKSRGRQGADCLDIEPGDWLKKGPNPDACPRLADVQAILRQVAELHGALAFQLAGDTIVALRREMRQFKAAGGRISYADMLEQVETALNGDQAKMLLRRLRRKFRFAFVDEFQDTDPIQWRIFQRIFLDKGGPHAGECRLALIGDPKQAIYSFRGADVYTYLTARSEMERLQRNGKAHLYSLNRNWRSSAAMVSCFNRLFKGGQWFPELSQAAGFEIGYGDADAPGDMRLPENLSADDSGRPCLNAIDLRSCASSRCARERLSGYIAREIRYLTGQGGLRIAPPKAGERPLDMGDIAILVRGKNESPAVEAALREGGVPFSFYKKPGLFQSEEATFLSWILHAVIDPNDVAAVNRALLTPFFDRKPSEMLRCTALPPEHPAMRLLAAWNTYARQRRWGRLFQSLLEESGLVFRASAGREWERMQTTYHQMMVYLTHAAYRGNLDFDSLCALLDGLRRETAEADDDGNIHQIETEERKVRIMTMHASKGLQFPVVFIAGGLTQSNRENYHVYHQEPWEPVEIPQKIIDLTKQANPAQHAREQLEEEKRLLYVALTRAQFKLYIPYWPRESNQKWIGPVRRFLADNLTERFTGEDMPVSAGLQDATIGGTAGPEIDKAAQGTVGKVPYSQEIPVAGDYFDQKVRMESFSSIHRRQTVAEYGSEKTVMTPAGRDEAREADEGFPAFYLDNGAAEAQREELPGGADMGTMFHAILEKIDFQQVAAQPETFFRDPRTRELIATQMQLYSVEAVWQKAVENIIRDTLLARVGHGREAIVLGRIPTRDRIHEAEFYFPFDGVLPIDRDARMCRDPDGYIRGFIDLVFRKGGKYFIADWKSNRLAAGYAQTEMAACMDASGYHLQYRLYSLALLRWLGKMHTSPETRFGGVYYFFLRGMRAGTPEGIYYVSPQQVGTLAELEKELLSVANPAGTTQKSMLP